MFRDSPLFHIFPENTERTLDTESLMDQNWDCGLATAMVI